MPTKKPSRRIRLNRETVHSLTEGPTAAASGPFCCSYFKCINTACPTCDFSV